VILCCSLVDVSSLLQYVYLSTVLGLQCGRNDPLCSILEVGVCDAVHWGLVKSELRELLGFAFSQRRYEPHEFEAGCETCTCSFTVEWQDGPQKGKRKTLGCGGICLLSTKDVETHALIIDLLRHANQEDERVLVKQQAGGNCRAKSRKQSPMQPRSRKRATTNHPLPIGTVKEQSKGES
jgi:hypothetical protein